MAFTKATQFIKPCQDPDVFVSLGSVYLEKEDWPKAKQYFERAVELSPSAASWYGSAVAAYRLEMYESAYMAFGEANLLDTERTVIRATLRDRGRGFVHIFRKPALGYIEADFRN